MTGEYTDIQHTDNPGVHIPKVHNLGNHVGIVQM